uniref:VP2 n=2 Tax=Equine encephalosis virus TaxID=201490 RepID=A0A7U1BCG7_9REOV|nr:VP2 [Equine encephalosis virus 4]
MDFRILVCDDNGSKSSLTDDDLETYEDESTIIIRINVQNLVTINNMMTQVRDIDMLGQPLQSDNISSADFVWRKGLTSVDVFEPTVPISEVLKNTKLTSETSSTQLAAVRYGKLTKAGRKQLSGEKQDKRQTFMKVNGVWLERARFEEQLVMQCSMNENRDIMLRDITRMTGNRVKVRTLIGDVNMPGWLEGMYGLVRESRHKSVCTWTRESFQLYELGMLFLYERYKYIAVTATVGRALERAPQEVVNVVNRLKKGKFQRERFKQVRRMVNIPECVGGGDYSVPEGVVYTHLAVYMKILEVSSVAFLEDERKRISTLVSTMTKSSKLNFLDFKVTGNSVLLRKINDVLNRRDNILGINRTHRSGVSFYFATDTPEYVAWKQSMNLRDFSASAYADWIMREDSKHLVRFFGEKVNFANYLRFWKVIPRDFLFPNVYTHLGVKLSEQGRRKHFDSLFSWFSLNVTPLIHGGEDAKMLSRIIELTIRTVYKDGVPKCASGSIISFLKVVNFCTTGEKMGDQFNERVVHIDGDDDDGVFWVAKQSQTTPTKEGITLSQASLIACREYKRALMDDPSYEASAEKDILVGEQEDVHTLFPKTEIDKNWISVERFIGYSYKLYTSKKPNERSEMKSFPEALWSPQSQYLRHNIIVRGGCRQMRENVSDRSYSNQLLQFTPDEGESNHPCIVSKLLRVSDLGVGSLITFYFGRILKYDLVISMLISTYLNKLGRFSQEFQNEMERRFPDVRKEMQEAMVNMKRNGRMTLRKEVQYMLLSPCNCFALDITIDQALKTLFDLTVSLTGLIELLRTTVKKSEALEVISGLKFNGTIKDLFIWNIHVFIVALIVPEFVDYPHTVPIFVGTSAECLPIPITMTSGTLGGAATNIFRYFDTITPGELMEKELSRDERTLLASLREIYIDKPHWRDWRRSLSGTYTPMQTWIGLGCCGIREKLEMMVPTARPGQSHFTISLSSGDVPESDATYVESVLEEGAGLGCVKIEVNDEGEIRITGNIPKFKKYKHLAHSEMLDGCIIMLDAASRFDTYMSSKILN